MRLPVFNRYPMEIYKAYNDYFGSNFTPEYIDKQDDTKVAAHSLTGGYEEYCKLILKYRLDYYVHG